MLRCSTCKIPFPQPLNPELVNIEWLTGDPILEESYDKNGRALILSVRIVHNKQSCTTDDWYWDHLHRFIHYFDDYNRDFAFTFDVPGWTQVLPFILPPTKEPVTVKPGRRFQIMRRDNFTCQLCGRKAPDVSLEIDHKIPRAKGGPDRIENLWTLCFDCNRGKRDKTL